MVDQHLVIDIGPNVLTALLALFASVPGMLAAYYAFMNGRKIDTANSHLALALTQSSNTQGESRLTISPLPIKVG